MRELVSIVAPMYNEEQIVHEYCAETIKAIKTQERDFDFEIILVNDGSNDSTYENILKEQADRPDIITTICLSRNFGLEGAVNAGLKMAKGDAVIVMDADLQDPPILIPEMIKKWKSGADIVVGSRIKRSNDGFLKRKGAALYYKVLDAFSGKIKLEKSAANYRLLSRKALNQILELPEVNSVFRVVVPFIGMKTDVIEYDRDKRFAGKTKYSFKSMVPYALDSITGISIMPLRRIVYLLPIDFVLLLIFILLSVLSDDYYLKFLGGFGIIASIFTGIILSSLVVMAEYVGQIMIEVKGRPESIIYDYKPSNIVKERGDKSELC